ncbi:hypothetical protein BX661DRAFT_221431 [Kickxella alabastrina]|uniref:uncharacterized protein n=1 Tax=Kickxella alabastrina TaxID=61397 RepID=UPI00222088F9|nr:uncharacterized protein BX661DRAFT_221431 [Kickxella alabastrina]KAI7834407.1 hypothetical protein BX661DRAFT_221431 [Kickxella alabastrina]
MLEETPASKRPRLQHSSSDNDGDIVDSSTKGAKSIGGRCRPAALALMFEAVHSNTAVVTQASDRPLNLLLTDASTREYIEPELHDCRVRCVLDSADARAIVYRAKRMQAKLDAHLHNDRAQFIHVFQQRMQRLQESGQFNAADMQVLRSHFAVLEGNQQQPEADSEGAASVAAAAAAAGDVVAAVVRLKASFALPANFVDAPETHALFHALFAAAGASMQAGRPQSLPLPLLTRASYASALDDALRDAQLRTCRRISKHIADGGATLLLHGRRIRGGPRGIVRISIGVRRQALLLDWAVAGDAADAAAQVIGAVARLSDIAAGRGQRGSGSARLIGVVAAGNWPLIADVRRRVAAYLGCAWHAACAMQQIDVLAYGLLHARRAGIGSNSRALEQAAAAIAADPAAHALWLAHGHRPLNSGARTGGRVAGLLATFQRMVRVDYGLLQRLRALVGEAAYVHFDCLLDRLRAPMFLALVQALRLLGHCARVLGQAPLLPDAALLLARLEVTLELLAAPAHSASNADAAPVSDELRAVAGHLLAHLRRWLAESNKQQQQQQQWQCFDMPHPGALAITLIDTARTLWCILQTAENDSTAFSTPELYMHWDASRAALGHVRQTSAEDLPADFAMRRIFDLSGLASADRSHHYQPFVSVAAALCDAMACVPGMHWDDSWDDCAVDEMRYRELLLVALMDAFDSTGDLGLEVPPLILPVVSVAEHQRKLISSCVDLNVLAEGDPDNADLDLDSDSAQPTLAAEPFHATELIHTKEAGSIANAAAANSSSAYDATDVIATWPADDGNDDGSGDGNDDNIDNSIETDSINADAASAANDDRSLDDQQSLDNQRSLLLCYFNRDRLQSLVQI